MVSINDCRISWLKPHAATVGRLRVQHLPSGLEAERQTALRDDWKLDDLLAQIDAKLEGRDEYGNLKSL
jgi:hypothetical protein